MLRRTAWALLVAAAAVAAVSAALARPTRGGVRLLPWRDITSQVGPVEFGGPEQHRFRKQQDLASFLRHVETGPSFRIPRVDFSRYEVFIFAVGPRSSSGYALRVREVREDGGRIRVVVDERSPSLGSRARPELTFPLVVVRLPRSDEPVSVLWPQQP